MADKKVNWIKGCAIGCGVLVALPVLAVLVVGLRTWVPLRSSGKTLARLEEKFGAQDAYVPAPDGAIAQSRIQAFLEVRRSLAELCAEMDAMDRTLDHVGTFEGEEPSAGEIANTGKEFTGVATGISPLVGRFFKQRNRALLDIGIGFGEYSYIFALAYREQFLDESIHQPLFSEDGPLSPEVSEALRAMLAHQLDSLAEGPATGDRRDALADEILAMQRDPQRLPWRDDLPPEIEASLEPFRGQLDASFCLSSAGIDLDPDSRRALYIALH